MDAEEAIPGSQGEESWLHPENPTTPSRRKTSEEIVPESDDEDIDNLALSPPVLPATVLKVRSPLPQLPTTCQMEPFVEILISPFSTPSWSTRVATPASTRVSSPVSSPSPDAAPLNDILPLFTLSRDGSTMPGSDASRRRGFPEDHSVAENSQTQSNQENNDLQLALALALAQEDLQVEDPADVLRRNVGAGLINPDKHCYFNSVLQVLFRLPCVAKVWEDHRGNCKSDGFCIPCALDRTRARVLSNPMPYLPDLVTNNIEKFGPVTERVIRYTEFGPVTELVPLFSRSIMSDAGEFLEYTMEYITSICGSSGLSARTQAIRQCCNPGCTHTWTSPGSDSYQSCVQLRIKDAGIVSSLEEALNLSSKFDDPVSVATSCICGDYSFVEATRLKAASDVLVFQLPIFDYLAGAGGGFKLHVDITYPIQLRVCPPFASSDLGTYALQGVVAHVGPDLNMGHFYSTVKVGNRWWCLDDSSVSQVHAPPTSGAYLLFYRRVSHTTPETLSSLSTTLNSSLSSTTLISSSSSTILNSSSSLTTLISPSDKSLSASTLITNNGVLPAKTNTLVQPKENNKQFNYHSDSDFDSEGYAAPSVEPKKRLVHPRNSKNPVSTSAIDARPAPLVKTKKHGPPKKSKVCKAVPSASETSSETQTDSDFGPSSKLVSISAMDASSIIPVKRKVCISTLLLLSKLIGVVAAQADTVLKSIPAKRTKTDVRLERIINLMKAAPKQRLTVPQIAEKTSKDLDKLSKKTIRSIINQSTRFRQLPIKEKNAYLYALTDVLDTGIQAKKGFIEVDADNVERKCDMNMKEDTMQQTKTTFLTKMDAKMDPSLSTQLPSSTNSSVSASSGDSEIARIRKAMDQTPGKRLTISQIITKLKPAGLQEDETKRFENSIKRIVWKNFKQTQQKVGRNPLWTLPELEVEVTPSLRNLICGVLKAKPNRVFSSFDICEAIAQENATYDINDPTFRRTRGNEKRTTNSYQWSGPRAKQQAAGSDIEDDAAEADDEGTGGHGMAEAIDDEQGEGLADKPQTSSLSGSSNTLPSLALACKEIFRDASNGVISTNGTLTKDQVCRLILQRYPAFGSKPQATFRGSVSTELGRKQKKHSRSTKDGTTIYYEVPGFEGQVDTSSKPYVPYERVPWHQYVCAALYDAPDHTLSKVDLVTKFKADYSIAPGKLHKFLQQNASSAFVSKVDGNIRLASTWQTAWQTLFGTPPPFLLPSTPPASAPSPVVISPSAICPPQRPRVTWREMCTKLISNSLDGVLTARNIHFMIPLQYEYYRVHGLTNIDKAIINVTLSTYFKKADKGLLGKWVYALPDDSSSSVSSSRLTYKELCYRALQNAQEPLSHQEICQWALDTYPNMPRRRRWRNSLRDCLRKGKDIFVLAEVDNGYQKWTLQESSTPLSLSKPPRSSSSSSKPKITHVQLCKAALLAAPCHQLTAAQVCEWVSEQYEFYTLGVGSWQGSIASCLAYNNQFAKADVLKNGKIVWALASEQASVCANCSTVVLGVTPIWREALEELLLDKEGLNVLRLDVPPDWCLCCQERWKYLKRHWTEMGYFDILCDFARLKACDGRADTIIESDDLGDLLNPAKVEDDTPACAILSFLMKIFCRFLFPCRILEKSSPKVTVLGGFKKLKERGILVDDEDEDEELNGEGEGEGEDESDDEGEGENESDDEDEDQDENDVDEDKADNYKFTDEYHSDFNYSDSDYSDSDYSDSDYSDSDSDNFDSVETTETDFGFGKGYIYTDKTPYHIFVSAERTAKIEAQKAGVEDDSEYERALSSKKHIKGIEHGEVDHGHVKSHVTKEIAINDIVSKNGNGSAALVVHTSHKIGCDPGDPKVENVLVNHHKGKHAKVFSDELRNAYKKLSEPLLKQQGLWKRKDRRGTKRAYQIIHEEVVRKLPEHLREELESVIANATTNHPTGTPLKPGEEIVPDHIHELAELLGISDSLTNRLLGFLTVSVRLEPGGSYGDQISRTIQRTVDVIKRGKLKALITTIYRSEAAVLFAWLEAATPLMELEKLQASKITDDLLDALGVERNEVFWSIVEHWRAQFSQRLKELVIIKSYRRRIKALNIMLDEHLDTRMDKDGNIVGKYAKEIQEYLIQVKAVHMTPQQWRHLLWPGYRHAFENVYLSN
ncbi:Ubiquitin carboxyl-terminal hydrolase 42 [Stygiomarasmius scandens]|uniref:ubiquitinyl hydrolase 1 n=1 Tax=Marasmiellus scandens TaxID=2682957 RepID=A0ABR1JG98_9AGAR